MYVCMLLEMSFEKYRMIYKGLWRTKGNVFIAEKK